MWEQRSSQKIGRCLFVFDFSKLLWINNPPHKKKHITTYQIAKGQRYDLEIHAYIFFISMKSDAEYLDHIRKSLYCMEWKGNLDGQWSRQMA